MMAYASSLSGFKDGSLQGDSARLDEEAFCFIYRSRDNVPEPTHRGSGRMNDSSSRELERRIVALESQSETGDDFDAVSWWWIIGLGIVLPLGLIVLGWFV
jgi:hypothetical protein